MHRNGVGMDDQIKTYCIDIRQFNEETYMHTYEELSPYRRQKIALLKHEQDKKRSIGAAAALDHALLEYGLRERMMEYEFGRHGKPYLRDYPEIFFSLSHSGDYAICSIGRKPIGNDIEKVREGRLQVAQRFFSIQETAWVYRAEGRREQEDRMFRLWTMKESFLKVTGMGMSLALDSFTIESKRDGNFFVEHNINEKMYYLKEYNKWMYRLDDGYKLAVCSESAVFSDEPELITL